jgi:hypothetical protein
MISPDLYQTVKAFLPRASKASCTLATSTWDGTPSQASGHMRIITEKHRGNIE